DELARERHRGCQTGPWNYAQPGQIGVGIVMNGDDFLRDGRGALEIRVSDARAFAAPVARAERAQLLRRRRSLPGRAARVRRGRRWVRGVAARPAVRRLAPRLERVLARNAHRRLRLPAEHRHADHADVVGPARARGVGLRVFGEKERCDALQALAPAPDVVGLPRPEDVAGLTPRRRFPGDGVHTIDRDHRQHIAARAVAHPDLIFVARLADDVKTPLVAIHGQRAALGPVVDRDVEYVTDRTGGS